MRNPANHFFFFLFFFGDLVAISEKWIPSKLEKQQQQQKKKMKRSAVSLIKPTDIISALRRIW